MNNFDDVSQIYSVDFEIKTQIIMGRVECFDAEHKKTQQFKSRKPYKTLNESIDAAIDALTKLKEPVK
jgi:hypothetical protein